MPERNFDALDGDARKKAAEYVPGYDWVPGKFGPPPGILKARKEEFDRMSDKEYLYAFLKLSQEEKESLMVSEAERRRTFAAHWPIESIVKAHDCAKEGFYYTGVADRVQCAFCGGIVRNWERGDVPKFQHKNCNMVQNNIPVRDSGLPKDLMTIQLSNPAPENRLKGSTTIGDNTLVPKDPLLSVFSKRRETYRRYPESNPVDADRLCDAGFLYEGIGDKVKCFWCDGALEMWSRGDDPWVEHAKWYPGCIYVQEKKGVAFMKQIRQQMTADDIATAESLHYNSGDVSFLEDEQVEEPVLPVKIRNVPNPTNADIAELLRENEVHGIKRDKAAKADPTAQSKSRVNIPDNATRQQIEDCIDALKCKTCGKNKSGALLLPCGCYAICNDCADKDKLPDKCLACGEIVKGVFKASLF